MAEKKQQQAFDETAAEEASLPEDSEPTQPEPQDVEAELEALRAERDELRDRLMRAYAEVENTRKRAEKDRREGLLYGGAKLARDMLPVHDSLARALGAVNDDARTHAGGLVEGVEITLRELANVMSRHGIVQITPKIGDTFDPHLHQAMFEAPVPDTSAGQVIQVMADGFTLHDKLLRPAQVGVSSGPAS